MGISAAETPVLAAKEADGKGLGGEPGVDGKEAKRGPAKLDVGSAD